MTSSPTRAFHATAEVLRASPEEGLQAAVDSQLIVGCRPDALRDGGAYLQRAAESFAVALSAAVPQVDAAHPLIVQLRAHAPRSALMLSGGGKLGNYHIGVVRRLLADRLLPNVVSGSSAGAFIAALLATRTDAELTELLRGEARELASDSLAGALEAASVAFSQPGLRLFLERLIPDMTLAEARQLSGRNVNIVVAREKDEGGGRVLNADVTPDVLIRDAVVASCAIPYVYPAARIGERTPDGRTGFLADGARFIDGSLHADLPAAWLRERCGATNLVASVVNPYELPFLTDPDHHGSAFHAAASFGMNMVRDAMSAGVALALPFAQAAPGGAQALTYWKQVLDQRIDADVIIAPGQRLHDFMHLTDQITGTQLAAFIAEGEAAVSARMGVLAPSLRIERALAGV
jgi:TAG lipase / steryl ester hydrolase / phospholipase A2 / LPA acyltransferase